MSRRRSSGGVAEGEGKKKKVSWRSSRSSLGGYIREQKGKLYIIRSCIVMLLCWHD
ncbi:uncharacterized protein LOC111013296 [Momordica charantia]|uniref:Uncharacterized protein LOC111013296 n=1 Tax=Momordica charantia TaxID=3673 RepID=A0A6J1CQ69_MOMCH|nr:uncharacterized protein LOC111013296 [Momordica charantia]